MVGEGCEKPEESCLVFGWGSDYYRKNGTGRVIDREGMLEILKKADKAGLVLRPSNARKIVSICCFCGCCCQILKNLKRYPKPAGLVSSPFVAAAHLETCQGCGLCVSTCPTQSLTLLRKPVAEQREVPRSVLEMSLQLGRKRGKLGPVRLARMELKSKLDRMLAAR